MLECKRFLVALGASLAELYPDESTLSLVPVVLVMAPTSPISISSLLAPESSHSWLFDLLRLISCLIPVLCFLMAGGVASPCLVCEGGKAGGLRIEDLRIVAKGSEVLFDVGVLGLLGWKKSKTSKNFLFLVNKQLFTNKQEFVITLYRRPNIDILVALRRQ